MPMPNAFARKLKGYGPLSDQAVQALDTACSHVRTVPARHDLIREGDRPGPVFVVLEGWACRYKIMPNGDRQIMAFLMPGDCCDIHVGTLAEMDHAIGTVTRCRIATISPERMQNLLDTTPNLTRAFWRAQLVDEGILRAWIVSMGRRDSVERVAHLMLELYARMFNIGQASGQTCELPLTQIVIADALGLTPVHVNRVLAQLRKRNIMELGSATLTLLDPEELARVAGFDDNYLHRRMRQAA